MTNTLLKIANHTMAIAFVSFLIATYFAYGYEAKLPLALLVFLHISQILLAGIFKLSYVIRLVALEKAGLTLK